jgi:membrane protease YdiL (CAAX protease family)
LIVREFSSGALLEELLFRGFFWGYLRRQISEEGKIYWIQFILFWFVHLRRVVTAPFTFFIAIPLLAMLSSQLTLRSRQIFPAVLSHTVINILSTLLNLAAY